MPANDNMGSSEDLRTVLSKLATGLIAEIRKLRGELSELRAELNEVERILTGHIQASGSGGRIRSHHHGPVSEGLRAIIAKGRGA